MHKIYYYCVWFTTTVCPAGFDHGSRWVESFFDREEAYTYFHKLKTESKVTIWHEATCVVDTSTVVLDSLKFSDYQHKK